MDAQSERTKEQLDFLNKTLVPSIRRLAFPPRIDNSSVMFESDSHLREELTIILPSVACFCLGIILAAVAGFIFYKKVKLKDRKSSLDKMDNPKFTLFQNNPLGEFFLYKEGNISEDTQSALNFLATPFIFESKPEDGLDSKEETLIDFQSDTTETTDLSGTTLGESTTDSSNIDSQVDLLKDAVPAFQDVVWSVPDSDVRVTIPTASLPKTRGQSSIKVALGANPLNVISNSKEVQLTPLLILSSPNITRFNKPVELRIPHRANLYAENNWELTLRYSGTEENNINKLNWHDATLDLNEELSGCDVLFRYDQEFVYMKTFFPGLFCVVGTGSRKKRPLDIAAMAFAYPLPPQTCEPEPGQEVVKTGVDIKVFLIDSIREAIQHLKKTEEESGGISISQPLPMRMVNEKEWKVDLVSADWPQWAYDLHDNQRLRTASSDLLYNELGTGVPLEFRIFTKPNQEIQSETFEATFSISQHRKKPSNVVTYMLVTRPFPLPKSNSSMGSDCKVRLLDFPVHLGNDEGNMVFA